MKKLSFIFCYLFLFETIIQAQTDLNYYINAAKQNSPLILDNQNQSKANQLEAERLKAFYTKPQVGVTANYLFSPVVGKINGENHFDPNSSGNKFETNANGTSSYFGYDLAASNGGQYQALLNITQPLFNGQRYKTFAEQLNVTAQVNQNNIKLTGHDVEKVVTDQYILCLQDNRQIEYANGMVQLLNEQKSVIQKLVENSIYKQSDLILINIEYQNFLGQLTMFKATYQRDLMDLNVICGVSDSTLKQLTPIDLQITGNVIASGFNEKYRLDSLNLIAMQKNFELKYKPQLNVFANTGLNAVYAPTIPNRFGMSAGFSFTYNFLDGNQKNINRRKTEVLLNSVSNYKDNFNKINVVRKSKVLRELQSYTDRVSIAEQQLKEYNTLLNSYKKEIVLGQLSIINYITTLKNMATVQRDYLLLFYQKQTLINAYNYWNW